MAIFILLAYLCTLDQNGHQVFSNKEFKIVYTSEELDTCKYIKGTIHHKDDSLKPALNTNIWSDCLFANEIQSGTVPNANGSFALKIPLTCNELNFHKYGYDKISLKILNSN